MIVINGHRGKVLWVEYLWTTSKLIQQLLAFVRVLSNSL